MSCNENNCLSGTPARSNADWEEDHAVPMFRVPASRVTILPHKLTEVTSDVVISGFDCTLIIKGNFYMDVATFVNTY